MTEWIDFVKKVASEKGISYKEAMTIASPLYKKMKGGSDSIPPKKERKKRVKKVKADFVVDEQGGEGVIGDIVERVKDVIFLRDDPAGSPSVRANMKKFGDKKIVSMQVCRQPISRMLRTLLNITTLGGVEKYLKTHSHDELFHLYGVVTLEGGTRLQIEKNERVSVSPKVRALSKKGSCVDVPKIPDGLTFGELMNNTKTQMGKDFFVYQSATSNCQGFMTNVLTSNKMMTPELNTFVNQDTIKIFKRAPWSSKIANLITDTAKRVDIALTGKGIEEQPKKRGRKPKK
jgi:hypothetical protein